MAIDSVLWVQFGVFGDLSDRTNWTEFPPSVIYYSEQLFSGLAEQFKINDDLVSFFSNYWDNNKVPNPALFASGFVIEEPSVAATPELQDLIAAAALSDDAAIVTIGRQAGEGGDRSSGAGDYLLSAEELEMINAVSAAFHAQDKKVTVVLSVNGVRSNFV